MDWVYNVPIKFFEYNLEEFKDRLTSFDENVLLIASKRVINSLDLDWENLTNFNIFDESLANPDIHLIDRVLSEIDKPDLIIAIGGGSSIDLAKAISALYDYKDKDILDLLKSKEYLENEH